MKKILLAGLLAFPLVASAGFVDDCKTAYVASDLGVKINSLIGGTTDYAKAEKPFASRCECIFESVTSEKQATFLLDYIQYNGQIYGGRDRLVATRIISQCESKISEKERSNYIAKATSKKDACFNEELSLIEASAEDKKKALDEIKAAIKNNGNWAVAKDKEVRMIAIRLSNVCY